MVAPLVIGGIAAGIAVVSGTIWYFIRRARSGRIGLEHEEIKEDRGLLTMDKRIRAAAMDEKQLANNLEHLLYILEDRARRIGFDTRNKRGDFDFIINELGILKKVGRSVLQDRRIMAELNDAINKYLEGFPIQDKFINSVVSEIRANQARLFADIIKQDTLSSQEEKLLRKKYSEIQRERGA